jgi:hypothetical protein
MSKPKVKPTPYLFAVRDPPPVEQGRHRALMALIFLKMDDDDFGQDQ